jgi:hypothetical protein
MLTMFFGDPLKYVSHARDAVVYAQFLSHHVARVNPIQFKHSMLEGLIEDISNTPRFAVL